MPDDPAHVGTELAPASTCALCRARRRVLGRSKPVGVVTQPKVSAADRCAVAAICSLLCEAVRKAARGGKLSRLPETVSVERLVASAAAHEWIVYAKPPFGGAGQVLEYLSQYTHRIAISNSRIETYENSKVTFRWRDYRDHNEVKHCTLDAFEFLRRFLMHVPPTGFVRIRSFGFLGNRNRKKNIERARLLIAHLTTPRFRERLKALKLCPDCYAARRADPARVPAPRQAGPAEPAPRPPPIEVQAA